MRKLRPGIVVAVFTIVTIAAHAGGKVKFVTDNTLPFSIKTVGVEDRLVGGQSWTTATVRVANGMQYVGEVEISCEAGNAEGYTWALKGKVEGLLPKEVRTAKIVSISGADPKYWSNTSKVRCEVSGLASPTWLVDVDAPSR
jgi:hypothetical protein